MCNRNGCECGCGCNRRWEEGEFRNREFEGRNDACWREAEHIMRERDRRRCHEDRCAREFVRCIRCRDWNY